LQQKAENNEKEETKLNEIQKDEEIQKYNKNIESILINADEYTKKEHFRKALTN